MKTSLIATVMLIAFAVGCSQDQEPKVKVMDYNDPQLTPSLTIQDVFEYYHRDSVTYQELENLSARKENRVAINVYDVTEKDLALKENREPRRNPQMSWFGESTHTCTAVCQGCTLMITGVPGDCVCVPTGYGLSIQCTRSASKYVACTTCTPY